MKTVHWMSFYGLLFFQAERAPAQAASPEGLCGDSAPRDDPRLPVRHRRKRRSRRPRTRLSQPHVQNQQGRNNGHSNFHLLFYIARVLFTA